MNDQTLTAVLVTVLGAIVGSFLNVVIHRLPEGKSVVSPRSSCPGCGSFIAWYDNVPVVSWLILGARCRHCRKPIPWRYPAVELVTAGLFWLSWRQTVATTPPAAADWVWFGACALFCAALVAATFIDIDHRIIPDKITKPGMILAPIASLVAPALHRGSPLWNALEGTGTAGRALFCSVAGIAVGAGTILAIGWLGKWLFKKEAMGFGDVKFMGFIGGFLGPSGVVAAIVVACFAGAIFGIASMLITRSRYIPFGPYLSLGSVLILFWRDDVFRFLVEDYPRLLRDLFS